MATNRETRSDALMSEFDDDRVLLKDTRTVWLCLCVDVIRGFRDHDNTAHGHIYTHLYLI